MSDGFKRNECHFLVRLIVCLPFCACCVTAAVGFTPTPAPPPLAPLALGFNGESAGLDNGPGPGGDVVIGIDISPVVVFLLIPGRLFVVGLPTLSLSPLWSLCLSNSGKLEKDDSGMSDPDPRANLRDFSCLDWTERKCCRRSCHLISSRTSFERVDMGPTVL